MRKAAATTLYLLYFAVVVVVLLESIMRVYDPFQFRQQGDTVVLPRNRKMVIENNKIPVLDRKIVHTKNSLGFRGPEPENISDLNSIIAVGGSTTECFYLNDTSCWTYLLANRLRSHYPDVWINNAGYQGHSTFGNNILLNQFIKQLRPRYIMLMEGMNEVNRTDLIQNESVSRSAKQVSTWGWLKRNSRVVSAMLNIQRYLLADRLKLTDNYADLRADERNYNRLSPQYCDSALLDQQPLVTAYKERMQEIIDTLIANNIKPILITQPMLFGEGTDDVSGADLGLYNVANVYNGELVWDLLEQYNDVTRLLAKENDLPVIDLARKLPKSSAYFYDICHFTPEGSREVSRIIAEDFINMRVLD